MGKILDNRRSYLSSSEISRFRDGITNLKNAPICKEKSTLDVVEQGFIRMQEDSYQLVKEQLDV